MLNRLILLKNTREEEKIASMIKGRWATWVKTSRYYLRGWGLSHVA